MKGNSNLERKLNEYMEGHVYQRYMKDEGSVDILVGNLNKGKVGNWLMKMSSMAQLGFNFLANTANVATGISMMNIEAAGGEFFDARSLLKGDKVYFQHLKSYMSELGNPNKSNFLSLMDEFLNIRGNYDETVRRNQKKNIFQKLFGSNLQFIGQEGGDHWLYHRAALAFLSKMQVLVPKETKITKKVRGINVALDTLDKIIQNSQAMELSEDESHYINTLTG